MRSAIRNDGRFWPSASWEMKARLTSRAVAISVRVWPHLPSQSANCMGSNIIAANLSVNYRLTAINHGLTFASWLESPDIAKVGTHGPRLIAVGKR